MDGTTFQFLITSAAGALYAVAERRRLAGALHICRQRLARHWPALGSANTAGPPRTDDGPYWHAGCVVTREWVANLNEKPDEFPHLFIVGPTGSGKTTFTTALLSSRAGAIVIITPKPDDRWGGLPTITIDDDASFTTVQRAFVALHTEVKRRLVAAKRGHPIGAPLTIVLDDAPALLSEGGKEAAALLKLVARLGRSLRMRLVLLSQSDRVKALGLEGEGDALDNFTRVALLAGHKGATWSVRGIELPLELVEVPRRASADLHTQVWHKVSTILGATSVPPGVPATPRNASGSNEGNEGVTACPSVVSPALPVAVSVQEAATIAHLLGRNRPSAVVKMLDGYTPRRYGEFKAKVEAVQALLAGVS